jgi:hypothetical protein
VRPAAFVRLLVTGVIAQNLPHRPGPEGAKVCLAVYLDSCLSDEFEIGLVDQHSGVERVVAAPAPTVAAGQFLQLAVKNGEKLVDGLAIAAAHFIEKPRYGLLSLVDS